MPYSVKEMFHTLQGEGANAGRSAVFCRFAGCNLWSGYEVDRANAICNFCDTDFVGVDGKNGGEFKEANELAEAVDKIWDVQVNNKKNNDNIFSNGGRVLNFVTISSSYKESRNNILKLINNLNWSNGFFRKDIGFKVIDK